MELVGLGLRWFREVFCGFFQVVIGGTLEVLCDAVLFREYQVADRTVIQFVQRSACGLVQDKATVPHEPGVADVALVASDGFRVFQQVLATTVFDEFPKGLEELAAAAASFAADRDDLVVGTIVDVGDEGRFRDCQVAMPRDGPVVVTKSRWIFISGREVKQLFLDCFVF